MYIDPDIPVRIDPDIAGIKVVVLTATSSAFTVMWVPAPIFNVELLPKLVDPPPVKPFPAVIVTAEFAKLALGTAAKPNVKVSVDALAEIVKPCPDPDANVKLPADESANNEAPLYEADANPFASVADVKYPESLFNCDMLLPDIKAIFKAIFQPANSLPIGIDSSPGVSRENSGDKLFKSSKSIIAKLVSIVCKTSPESDSGDVLQKMKLLNYLKIFVLPLI